MVSAAAAKVLGALFKIPLTNLLGGVGMSYFSCAYSVFMPVYALIVTGISSAVAAMTAKITALGLSARRVRSTAMLLFTAAGIPCSLLMIILAVPLSIYSIGSTEASAAVAMIAPAVIFGCITAVERGYYEGLSNMYPTAVSQVIEGIVKVTAGLLLCSLVMKHADAVMSHFPWITDIRAAAAAAGILGVTLSSAGAAVYLGLLRLFFRREKSGDDTVISRRAIAKELVRTALPIGLGALVTNLTALIDMWTVISCLSRFGTWQVLPEGVAKAEMPQFVYGSFAGMSVTVFNLVPSVTNMLGKSALACTAAAKERGDRARLCQSSVQALLVSAVLAVPAASGIAVLAPEILGLLFPRQTDETAVCADALRLLMPGMVCLCMAFPLFSMLQAVGRPDAPLKIMAAGTVVKLAGNLVLVPFFGVNGAAVSTSVCYAVILAAALKTYKKAAGVSIRLAAFAGTLYAGLMCGAAAGLVTSAAERASAGSMTALAAGVCAGGTAYFAALYLSGTFSMHNA